MHCSIFCAYCRPYTVPHISDCIWIILVMFCTFCNKVYEHYHIFITNIPLCLCSDSSSRVAVYLCTFTSWSVLCISRVGQRKVSLLIFAITLTTKSYRSLIALILPVILPILLFSLHSCFTQNVYGTEWPFMCWCAVKKLLTHLTTASQKVTQHAWSRFYVSFIWRIA